MPSLTDRKTPIDTCRSALRTALLLALLWLSACASSGTTKDQLYQDLGGEAGVARLVDALIVKYKADTRINALFAETDTAYFRERLIEDICVRAGGPCTYRGLSMADAHSGMDIKEGEFNYFVEDTQLVMEELGIATATQNALLALLAKDRADVIRQ
jgi:hemoglobin